MSTQHRADAVIIGGGLSGIVTAIELVRAGRSVVIVDRARKDIFGGQARESLGGMLFADTPQQRRVGVRDSADVFHQDWLRYGALPESARWPRAWARAYTHNATQDVYGWLGTHKLRFLPVVTWAERGLFETGNSAPRYILLWGGGYTLATRMIDVLMGLAGRLTLLFEHNVRELLTEGGRVVGCAGVNEADGSGFEAFGAATVVATGGIGANLERVRALWSPAWGRAPDTLLVGAHQYSDGQVHDAVERVGGAVSNLQHMWNYGTGIHHPRPRRPHHGLGLLPPRSGLWLDYQGRRFDPPLMGAFDTTYACEAIARQAVQHSWLLLNRKMVLKEIMISGSEHNPYLARRRIVPFLWENLAGNRRTWDYLERECTADVVTAADPAKLAAGMNRLTGASHVDAATLEATMQAYDTAIDRGPGTSGDAQIDRLALVRQWPGDRAKTCNFQKIADPGAGPLMAIRQHILSRKSLGGVETDLECRALRPDGSVIEGLYAVGEASGFGGGGSNGKRSLEGTFLAGCVLTGRYAGRAIAGAT